MFHEALQNAPLYFENETTYIPKDILDASSVRRILTSVELKHVIFWAAGDSFVGHWLWCWTVQTDINILTLWFALKANFTDVRPLKLKMRQERSSVFSQRVCFSRAPPPTNGKGSTSAEGASEGKLVFFRRAP